MLMFIDVKDIWTNIIKYLALDVWYMYWILGVLMWNKRNSWILCAAECIVVYHQSDGRLWYRAAKTAKKRRLRTNLQELVMWLIYWFGKYELTHSLIWWNRTQGKNNFQLSVSHHSAFRLPDPSMRNILLKYETWSNVDSMCPRRHLVFMKANNWCVHCATEQHVMPRASQSLNGQWMLWSLWQRHIFILFRFF